MSNAKRAMTAVALLALLVPARPAAADLGEMKHRFSSERIDLSLEDADIVSVLDIYRKVLGVEVRLQCGEERRVTIAFSNLTVRTSLDAICESAGLVWSLEEGEPPILRVDCGPPPPAMTDKAPKPAPGPGQGMVTVPRTAAKAGADPLAQTVSIELRDADLADTLAMVGRLVGGSGSMRLVVDLALSGRTVTVKAEKTTLRELLDTICAQAGARWELVPDPPPPTLKVRPVP
jgi:type II secretory pathway component GspD/PulD (secretin)